MVTIHRLIGFGLYRRRQTDARKRNSNRKKNTETAPVPALQPVPRPRTSICFQAQSNLSETSDPMRRQQLVHLYYVIRVVMNPPRPENDGGDVVDAAQVPNPPSEVKPVFISHCLFRRWFALGSGIYALGTCQTSSNHTHANDDLFRFFDFAHAPAERSWTTLPPPPPPCRLRSICAAASLNGRLFVFGRHNMLHFYVQEEDDVDDQENANDVEDEQPWLQVFDPTTRTWAPPFGDAPPAFPGSLDASCTMHTSEWNPQGILFSSPTINLTDMKFGYDVTDNHWEHVYSETQNQPPAVVPPSDDAILVNNDTFYYVSGINGHLYAYEIADDSCFCLRLEDYLAQKAQENELDFLHVEDDVFCFVWDNRYSREHRLLQCMQFRLAKVEKSDKETQDAGMKGTLEITVLSQDMFLVDHYMRRDKVVWLEGDWNEVRSVEFASPAREMETAYLSDSNFKIKHSINKLKRNLRQGLSGTN